jgi:predicted TIM-barrel fold metal-dependent hydrolase
MIWDLHCHLSGVPGATPDQRMARLIEYADRMGIDRLCVYMGMNLSIDPSPDDMRKQNDEVLQALSHWHHRAFGFVYLNPRHVEASLKELDRCVRDGPMVGVKLWVALRCNAEELDPIVRRATELRAVIFQHTWFKTGSDAQDAQRFSPGRSNLKGESTPLDLVALARRHPKASLICGHTGGNWELGIRAVRAVRNIAIDLAGSDPTNGFVEMTVRELGAQRILYGSDVAGRSFASQLAKVRGADVPETAKRLILGENLRRLLTPILRHKGVKP